MSEFIQEIVETVSMQMIEDEDNFIFRKIMPYCEEIVERKINKKDLERILTAGTKALKQEPCDDAISRQAVINAIANTCFWLSADNWEELTKCIDSLPSVTPQQKIGHWIDADGDNATCSCCNHLNFLYGTYCKHCGAKMIENEEEFDNLDTMLENLWNATGSEDCNG